MRILLFCSFAALVSGHAAHGEMVLDVFDQGVLIETAPTQFGATSNTATIGLTQDISGTRTATVSGTGVDWREGGGTGVPVHEHFLRANGGSPGTLTLDYNLTSAVDFTSSASHVLLLDIFGNVTPGTAWTYLLAVGSGASSASVSGTLSGGTVLTVEDDDFGSPAFASAVDRITLSLFGPNGGVVNQTAAAGGARILFVPEPSSFALLGLTGLGGVCVARRRRKSEKTS